MTPLLLRLCWQILVATADTTPPPATNQILTLEEVLATLHERHPYAAAALAKVAAARGKRLAAAGLYDPELSAKGTWVPDGAYTYSILDTQIRQTTPLWGTRLTAGYRRSSGNLPVYKGEAATLQNGVVWGGIELPLLKGGGIDRPRADIQSAERTIEVAEADNLDILLRLRREATEAYWAWAAASCRLEIEQRLLNIAESRTTSLETMVRHGEVPNIELVENQRAILLRQERVLIAERKLQETALKLSLYRRDLSGAPIIMAPAQAPKQLPELPALPAQLLEDTSIAQATRPDLLRLTAQREAAEVEMRLSENSVLPKLDVMVGAARDLENAKKTSAALLLGMQFSVPLPLREGRGKMQVATADLRRLQAETLYLRDKIATEVADVYSKLQNTQARFKLTTTEMAVAQTVERGERERFRLGDSSLLIVNIREQATADTAKRQLDSQLEYLTAWGEYQAVTAQLN